MKALELKEVVEAIADNYEGDFMVISLDETGEAPLIVYGGRGAVVGSFSDGIEVMGKAMARRGQTVTVSMVADVPCDCPKCVARRNSVN